MARFSIPMAAAILTTAITGTSVASERLQTTVTATVTAGTAAIAETSADLVSTASIAAPAPPLCLDAHAGAGISAEGGHSLSLDR